MTNAERYINAFARIEKHLRHQLKEQAHVSFMGLVGRAAQSSALVARWAHDLREYADLRNAIVHERMEDGRPIAEPHTTAVHNLERIAHLLVKPPGVLPTFKRKVYTVDRHAPVTQALQFVQANDFSQLPVLSDRRVVAMLTTATLARWLASQLDVGMIDLSDHTVAAVIKYQEYSDNWHLMGRASTLADVVAAFERKAAEGRVLDGVLISENGRPQEGLLGIATAHDIPEALRRLAGH